MDHRALEAHVQEKGDDVSDFGLDHLRHMVVKRRLVNVYDGSTDARVQTTPTVFFDSPRGCDDDTPPIPFALLDERKRRLDARLGTREWYLVTESGPSECLEELRGDFGVLIVRVDDAEAAKKELT